MSSKDIIDQFFNPKSIAVIGASKNPMKGGNRILINLTRNNFKGKIFPVNPNAEGEIFGWKFHKSISDIGENVDLAIFYVGNKIIPGLIQECIDNGIKAVLIEASGFEDGGAVGLALRDKIREITDNFTKLRIMGPNCMGFTKIEGDSNDPDEEKRGGLFTGFVPFFQYKRGNIGLISQSGMLNGGYLSYIFSRYPHMGFRYSVAIGNKMDLGETDFLEYFLHDDSVNVIPIYLEGFKNPRKFIKLCREAKKMPNKTIILTKGGVSEIGQRAGKSHTGSLAEDTRLIDGLIKQCGVIQAYNFYELFQLADTFSKLYITGKIFPIKGNVSMTTGSGGAGTISADLVNKYGLNFPNLTDQANALFDELYPEWMPHNKFALQDTWPTMEKAMMNKISPDIVMKKINDALLNEPEVEGLFSMMFVAKIFHSTTNFESVIKHLNSFSKPVFFWILGDAPSVTEFRGKLDEFNVPNFTTLEEMVRNFAALVQESKNNKKFTEYQKENSN